MSTVKQIKWTKGDGYINVTQDNGQITVTSDPNNLNIYREQKITIKGQGDTSSQLLVAQYPDYTKEVIPASYKLENYTTFLNNAKTRLETNRAKMGSDRVEFFFITDIHWGPRNESGDTIKYGNAKVTPYLIQWMRENANLENAYLLFGGDALYQSSTTKQAAIAEIRDMVRSFGWGKMFCTLGNHDMNDVEQYLSQSNYVEKETTISNDEIYDIMLKQNTLFPNYGNIIDLPNNPNAAYVNKLDADWFDDAEHKVRFIQFNYNIHNYRTGVTNTPANARAQDNLSLILKNTPSDYRAIAITHTMCNGGSTKAFSMTSSKYDENVNKLKFIIGGHVHSCVDESYDINGHTVPVFTRKDDLASAKTAVSNFYKDAEIGVAYDSCFTVVQVDFTNNKVYCTNVGYRNAGYDREYTIYD